MSASVERITPRQLTFLMAAFVQGSVFLLSFTADLTKRDTWLAVIAAAWVTLPFLYLQARLAERFPGQGLVQIIRTVYGKVLGTAIMAYYLFYFLLICSLNIADTADFYSLFLQPDSPKMLFWTGFALVCAFSVKKGMEVLARVSHLFVAIAFFAIVSGFVLLYKEVDFSAFLPLLEIKPLDFFRGTHIISAIVFGELTVFLTVMGSADLRGGLVRPALMGFAIGAVSLLIMTVRNVAVLGPMDPLLISPSFQSYRMIDLGLVSNRMDLLVGIAHTVVVFLKTSVILYAASATLAHVLGLRTYRPLVLPLAGILTIAAAGMIRESSIITVVTTKSLMIMYQVPLVYVIPPLTLLIAFLRRLPARGSRR